MIVSYNEEPSGIKFKILVTTVLDGNLESTAKPLFRLSQPKSVRTLGKAETQWQYVQSYGKPEFRGNSRSCGVYTVSALVWELMHL